VWTVLIGDEFEPEFLALPQVMTRLLQAIRPQLGRPNVDIRFARSDSHDCASMWLRKSR
jgi:hypothetical protein